MTECTSAQDDLVMQDRAVVEAEVSGRPVLFRTTVVKVTPTELWLGLASPDRRLETVRADQSIRLTVARTGAALVGDAAFLRPLGGSKSRIFAVTRPVTLEWVQRRAHARFEIDLPIRYRHLDPVTREPYGKPFTAVTVNVSPGGVLLESDGQVSIGEELYLTIPLWGGDPVSILGVVTRVLYGDAGAARGEGSTRTEAGIKFTRITSVDNRLLTRFIVLTEHRRRETAALLRPRSPMAAGAPGAGL